MWDVVRVVESTKRGCFYVDIRIRKLCTKLSVITIGKFGNRLSWFLVFGSKMEEIRGLHLGPKQMEPISHKYMNTLGFRQSSYGFK